MISLLTEPVQCERILHDETDIPEGRKQKEYKIPTNQPDGVRMAHSNFMQCQLGRAQAAMTRNHVTPGIAGGGDHFLLPCQFHHLFFEDAWFFDALILYGQGSSGLKYL